MARKRKNSPLPAKGPWPVDGAELDELQRLRLVGAASYTPPHAGERPSHRFGLGYDFADFHRYQPGDRIQHIDWTRYCLSGGRDVYVRKYYEELSADNAVILDASASMGAFADDDKLATAAHIAFLLLYMAAGRYESGDLVVLGGAGAASPEAEGYTVWPGLRSERMVEELEAELRGLEAAKAGTFESLLAGESALRSHFGSIVVVSDMFTLAGMLTRVLDALAVRTSRLHVVQLIGSLDRKPFAKAQDVEWYDVETGRIMKVYYDPEAHRRYVDELIKTIRSVVEDRGANYVRIECPVRGESRDLVRALLEGEVLEEA